MNAVCESAKSLQSCPTLCYPMDYSPLGSSIHGILQARILKWADISLSSIHTWEIPWTEEPAWWSTVHGVTKSQIRLSDQTTEVDACLVLQFKNLPNCFPEWLCHFTFPSTVYESSGSSTSSATLIIYSFLRITF